MQTLLRVAEIVAGAAARQRVFEPLLADWQREIANAESNGPRVLAALSGAAAFTRALVLCAVIDGIWIPPLRGSIIAMTWTTIAICLSAGIMLLAPLPPVIPRDLTEPVVQRYLLTMSGFVLPPVFLVAAFPLRRDARSTVRHAMLLTCVVAAATSVLVVNTTDEALRKRYDTFEMYEHLRDLSMASHRAGNVIYRGDRYQRELRSTVAERRANYERFQARLAQLPAPAPPTWGERVAFWRPVMLSVLFAMAGWILAGLGPATVARGFGWWALMLAALMTTTPLLGTMIRIPMPRTPQWLLLPLFAAVTLALGIGARRVRKNASS